MKTIRVTVQWHEVIWKEGDSWTYDIQPKLSRHKFTSTDLRHCVYVIRAAGPFAIQYGEKYSPVLYIGCGNLRQRIVAHNRKWLRDLSAIVGHSGLQIAVSVPKIRTGRYMHREMEAHLIDEFEERFGEIPLRNRIHGNHNQHNEIYVFCPRNEFKKPLTVGRGRKCYRWAVKPI